MTVAGENTTPWLTLTLSRASAATRGRGVTVVARSLRCSNRTAAATSADPARASRGVTANAAARFPANPVARNPDNCSTSLTPLAANETAAVARPTSPNDTGTRGTTARNAP